MALAEGKNPFQLDSPEPDTSKLMDYLMGENRVASLKNNFPEKTVVIVPVKGRTSLTQDMISSSLRSHSASMKSPSEEMEQQRHPTLNV